MMRILTLAATFASTYALPARRVTLENDITSFGNARSWEQVRASQETDAMTVFFMLKHSDETLRSLESLFWKVSDPLNSQYGEYLSQEHLAQRFAPAAEAVDAVTVFLSDNNIEHSLSATRDMVEATMPATVAAQLFATEVHAFQHKRTGLVLNRATQPYSLPVEVAQHVALVGDLVALPHVPTPITAEPAMSEKDDASWPTDCNKGGIFHKCGSALQKWVTPEVLKTRYKITYDESSKSVGSMAVAEFQGVMWDKHDFEIFEKTCGLAPGTINVTTQIGHDAPIDCRIPIIGGATCTEALLDIEYIKAIADDIPLTDIFNSKFSLLAWAKQVADLPSPPLIQSVSYGNDEKQQTSAAFMQESNVQFQKTGLRGISIMFATGDQGVWGRSGTLGGKFNPDFPTGSPFVTGVGGTDFLKAGELGDEKAWNNGGGGFSDTFPTAPYQVTAVNKYIQSKGGGAADFPAAKYFNASGRGYPDISALAGVQNPYCVVADGATTGVGGTSAACPVAAGIFAKVNSARIKSGGKPLGFLNPFIYQNTHCFQDVMHGNNKGAGRAGFPAVQGWE
jgi:tripeptidyl-peptidase-1